MSTEDCSICTDKLESKNRIYLECGHSFHCTCIFRLFSYNDKKCPLCRAEIKYEVPCNELQTRITNLENENKDLEDNNHILSYEYRLLNTLYQKQEEENNLAKAAYDLELKIREIAIQTLHAEKELLKEKNRKLATSNTNFNTLKNKLNKVKNDLKAEKDKNTKLESKLIELTNKGIKHANDTDKMLNEFQKYLKNLKSSNSSLRLHSRLYQPTRRDTFYRNTRSRF